MNSGAYAYLLKDASIKEITGTIRRVSAGEKVLPPELAQRLKGRAMRVELTGRELEVLNLLTAGKSNKEISSGLFISEDTVKTHLKGVFGKLNVKDRTEAAITAVRLGIVHLD